MDIFEIRDGKVVINENVLLIPRLKAVHEAYEDNIQALSYCHFMTHPASPYRNDDEEFQSELIYKEFPGTYKPVDKVICQAIEWLEARNLTTTRKFYIANKKLVEKLSAYAETVILDDSKDTGNIAHAMRLIEKCGKIIDEFRKLEKRHDEDMRKSRTNAKIAYDLM